MSDSKVWGLNPQRGLWYCAILSKRPFEIPILGLLCVPSLNPSFPLFPQVCIVCPVEMHDGLG